MRIGLIGRTVTASTLLAAIISGVFGILVYAASDERETSKLSRRSQEVLVVANQLERLVIDIETGERGFLLTHDSRFLDPWNSGRAQVPSVSRNLRELTATAEQRRRVDRITADIASYLSDYSIPLVTAARNGDPAARDTETLLRGKRRVDSLRTQFHVLVAAERRSAAAREAATENVTRWAIVIAAAGAAGSVVLIALFTAYLGRSIVVPVRHAAAMSRRLAGGDLTPRLPANGAGEIGTLERSFNEMAESLQRNRDELARLAAEQAALRRVATLVAHGVPEGDVFTAVAEESGQLLDVDGVWLMRFEPAEQLTVLAAWGIGTQAFRVGQRVSIVGAPVGSSVAATILATGRPARIAGFVDLPGEIPQTMRRIGVRSAVGVPIFVAGRTLGVITAVSTGEQPLPEHLEVRFADFTDLVATALANSQARADLVASRARVVAATDQTRRRIERDLHDGIQQRLVSLTLDLRAAESATSPGIRRELSGIADGLAETLDELREIARGIHPAILSEAGLRPALRALGRRSPVQVDLAIRIESRLPQPIEVAAYYVVAEALANATKHARATLVTVGAEVVDHGLRLTIHDDGTGGADPTAGTGLVGLTDRVEALGGTLVIASPPGRGTTLTVDLPLDSA